MVTRHLPSALLLTSLVLAAAPAARGQTCPSPPASVFPAAPAAFTHTATADGDWNQTGVWGGTVPGNNAIVCIPAGRKVRVVTPETARLRYVQVNGELRFGIHWNTKLTLDTLFLDTGGLFVIGDPVNTVKPTKKAELVFIAWNNGAIDRTWDPKEKSRGFVSRGTVRAYGQPKTHMVPTGQVFAGATSLTLASVPNNWLASDEVVLTGSYFRRVGTATSSQDERLTLTSVASLPTISFSPALAWDHVPPGSAFDLHVANLTRNLIFRSENATVSRRGHVMFMTRDVDIRHAAFVDLGRTNKAVPLDDMVVTNTTNSFGEPDYSITPRADNLITNRRGRYSVHFHKNGTIPGSAPPSKVWGSVVDGAVGWGFANHSSHVDFAQNVAYDFIGAGFVTELGDELGNFTGNIAIRGTGNGEYRNNRVVFANGQRPQPLSDFAFGGDGFWFQGPAVRAVDNVAAGCDGTGMIWFTTGAPDVDQLFTDLGGLSHVRYSHFPRGSVSTVYSAFPDLAAFLPRYWDHSAGNEKLVIADLPILECDGFQGYGNLVGFRLRFNNSGGTPWYNEAAFDFGDHIVPVLGGDKAAAVRMRENIENLELWNNELGIRANYAAESDWSSVKAVNRLDYNASSAYVGAEIGFVFNDSTFTGLTIDGYEVAGVTKNCDDDNTTEVTFPGGKTYLNYALQDTWNRKPVCSASKTCGVPTGVTVTTVSSTSRKISWTFNAAHKRTLVRYRANGDQQWSYASSTGTSVTISGLQTGRTYTYQLIAGCQDANGKETAPSVYTTAAIFNT
jgi:hypothetical protein